MSQLPHALAGRRLPESALVDVELLLAAYSDRQPDPSIPAECVRFGTSGHRGSSLSGSFNEWHVLAITQAICECRRERRIDGPLFLGIDTHALSKPAFESALAVLAANAVETRIAAHDEFTPTPAVSRAILAWNLQRGAARADGIVITPSHNPPEDGGFKYNPPEGGPADVSITAWIERRANHHLRTRLAEVRRFPIARARAAETTREHDFLDAYIRGLAAVVDLEAVHACGLRMAVDPLGGAGVHYWPRIAERYRLDLTVVSDLVDPRFAFMTADRDGRIRMDPSSPWAMQRLIGLRDRYDVAFACDTDHDRHGIVAASTGLMPPNHYLSVLVQELFTARPMWPQAAEVGKTVVTTSMIDRVAERLGRRLYETPVGFKWFVDGLLRGGLGFAGEESAGASVLCRDGAVWTTDKDGIALALLAGEVTARRGRDPGELYRALESEFGPVWADRVEAPANAGQRKLLGAIDAGSLPIDMLAGEIVRARLDRAPGNAEPIGGIKVVATSGWFAARPSGTEDVYKIYAESTAGQAHLRSLLAEAQAIVDAALASGEPAPAA